MILAVIIGTIILFLLYLIKFCYDVNKYFEKANIKHFKPMLFFGNSFKAFLGKEHMSAQTDLQYRSFPNEDVVGHFEYMRPIYVFKNPDMVQDLLTRDFSYFPDRVQVTGNIRSAADANLFFLSGNAWRGLRSKISPMFSSAKLKYMFDSMDSCGQDLMKTLDSYDGKEIDMVETMFHYSMAIIASCAYGIDPKANDINYLKFVKIADGIFANNFINTFNLAIVAVFPRFADFFNIKMARAYILNFFHGIIRESINKRIKDGVERKDFMQMMVQLKEKGYIKNYKREKSNDGMAVSDEGTDIKITDDLIIGGAFSFVFGGFHASAMTLTYAMYELSRRPDIVQKARDEIKQYVIDDKPTFVSLKKLKYMDNIINETLRLHPTARSTYRICAKDYSLPNGYVIKPGSMVCIPITGFHTDPKYFPEPELFNPERFETTEPKPGTFFPFGGGPRICLAMRFAQMELKYTLVKILTNYDIKLSDRTEIPIKLSTRVFPTTPAKPLYFCITKLRNSEADQRLISNGF